MNQKQSWALYMHHFTILIVALWSRLYYISILQKLKEIKWLAQSHTIANERAGTPRQTVWILSQEINRHPAATQYDTGN